MVGLAPFCSPPWPARPMAMSPVAVPSSCKMPRSEIAGKKFRQMAPYKPSSGISQEAYDSGVEAIKWSTGQAADGIQKASKQ